MMVVTHNSKKYRVAATLSRKRIVGALAISGLLIAGAPTTVLADAFLPPPELDAASQAMMDRLQRLESRLQRVDQLERRIEEQAMQGGQSTEQKENQKENESPKEELTLEQRIALRERINSQFEHIGQVNGTHRKS